MARTPEQNNAIITGSIPRQLLLFFFPIWLGTMFQQLYNTVDTLIVGNFVGTQALAAVGATSSFVQLLVGLFVGLCSGAGVIIAQSFGAGDHDEVNRQVHTALALAIAGGAALTVIGLLISRPVLRLMQTPDEIVGMASEYLQIYFLGMIPQMIYNMGTNILRAVGDSKRPLYFLIVASIVNIVLDIVLVAVIPLGVAGAAIATVLSQAVGAAWIIRFLTGKKTILRLRRDYLRPEKQIILPVLALGISSFVMLSTESLLSISFSSSLARYGGDVAVGAMTVITSASQLCTLPIQGICQGGQPVMSFNFGAGKKSRVKEAFRFQLTLCGCYTCLFWLLMMLAPGAVAGIFTSDTALIDYTTWSMRIYMAGIFAMGFQIACQQSFMALGQAKVSLLLACLRKIILLIPLIFVLPHLLPNPVFGVFLAEPVSDILAATITTITFFSRFNGILERGAAKV